jgi:solute carrier family 35 protein E1
MQRVACARSEQLVGYIFAWYAFNVAFNLYNKSALNAFPYPMFMATLELFCGACIMLLLWGVRAVEPPKLPKGFWKALFPVACFHLVNHVGTCFALSKSAVSFTHVIKSAEPFYYCLVLGLFFRQRFHPLVYLSLVPVVAGVIVAAVTEVHFSAAAFVTANLANLAVCMRTIVSKGLIKDAGLSGVNLYGCLTLMAFALLLPIALVTDGPNWVAGLSEGAAKIGVPQLLHLLVGGGVTYHLYNMSSYGALTTLSPMSYAVANVMKRVFIIGAAILFFSTPVTTASLGGTALALVGSFAYSRAKLLPDPGSASPADAKAAAA